jgi:hypothetical protein
VMSAAVALDTYLDDDDPGVCRLQAVTALIAAQPALLEMSPNTLRWAWTAT